MLAALGYSRLSILSSIIQVLSPGIYLLSSTVIHAHLVMLLIFQILQSRMYFLKDFFLSITIQQTST